jgi:hypothetical protein
MCEKRAPFIFLFECTRFEKDGWDDISYEHPKLNINPNSFSLDVAKDYIHKKMSACNQQVDCIIINFSWPNGGLYGYEKDNHLEMAKIVLDAISEAAPGIPLILDRIFLNKMCIQTFYKWIALLPKTISSVTIGRCLPEEPPRAIWSKLPHLEHIIVTEEPKSNLLYAGDETIYSRPREN